MFMFKGEFQEGESRYREAMDELKSSGECKELALANQRMGWSLYRQGRHSESLRLAYNFMIMFLSCDVLCKRCVVIYMTELKRTDKLSLLRIKTILAITCVRVQTN